MKMIVVFTNFYRKPLIGQFLKNCLQLLFYETRLEQWGKELAAKISLSLTKLL